jgi:hypothetical protein
MFIWKFIQTSGTLHVRYRIICWAYYFFSFIQISAYHVHLKVHSNVRDFACEVSYAEFTILCIHTDLCLPCSSESSFKRQGLCLWGIICWVYYSLNSSRYPQVSCSSLKVRQGLRNKLLLLLRLLFWRKKILPLSKQLNLLSTDHPLI